MLTRSTIGIALITFITLPLKAQDIIRMPKPPQPKRPPITTVEQANQDLKRKQNKRKKENPPQVKANPVSHLEAMSTIQKKWSTYSQASVMIPYMQTFGEIRKDYKAEPGMQFKLEFSLGDGYKPNQTSSWLGIRISPFAGSGTFKGENGRFSYLYWGPSFSVSRIYTPKKIKKKKEKSKEPSLQSWSHLRWSFGISGMSRYAGVRDDFKGGQGELSNKPLGFDSPGLWTEVTYGRIYGKTISWDTTFGLQSGESKIYAYLAIGMGLWH